MKKLLKYVVTILMAGLLLTGCGSVKKPDGTYVRGTVSLTFADKTVTVVEGSDSKKCEYSITKDGTVTFTLEGSKMTATYDKSTDSVKMEGKSYVKGYVETQGAAVTTSAAVTTKAVSGSYNTKIIDKYYGLTDQGYTSLDLVTDDKKADNNGKSSVLAKEKMIRPDGNKSCNVQENLKTYTSTVASGNQITFTAEDGTQEVWTYDENKRSITNGQWTFYAEGYTYGIFRTDSGEVKAAEGAMDVQYSCMCKKRWDANKKDEETKEVVLAFQADGKVIVTVDGQKTDELYYYVINGELYIDKGIRENINHEYYDAEKGEMSYNGMLLTKVQ